MIDNIGSSITIRQLDVKVKSTRSTRKFQLATPTTARPHTCTRQEFHGTFNFPPKSSMEFHRT